MLIWISFNGNLNLLQKPVMSNLNRINEKCKSFLNVCPITITSLWTLPGTKNGHGHWQNSLLQLYQFLTRSSILLFHYLPINYSLSSFLCWKLSILTASNIEMETTATSDKIWWSFQCNISWRKNTLFYKRTQIKYLLDFIAFPGQTLDIILKEQKSSMVILECKHEEVFWLL